MAKSKIVPREALSGEYKSKPTGDHGPGNVLKFDLLLKGALNVAFGSDSCMAWVRSTHSVLAGPKEEMASCDSADTSLIGFS